MKIGTLYILIGVSVLLSVSAGAEQPNVVLIYADDFGWGNLSVNGGNTPTPNMDRIFEQGMRFDQYTTHAVCSPSRGGLLTGRHYIDVKVGPRTGGELSLDETTMAESFKAAGYATGAFGKWHNGAPPAYGPDDEKKRFALGNGVNAHGFDRFVGFYGGGWDFYTRFADQYDQVAWYHDRTQWADEQGYTTDLITKHALEFINAHKDQPFFCYIPHEAVHAPFQAKYSDILRVPEAVRQGTELLTEEGYDSYFRVENGWRKLPKEQLPIVYSAMLISLDDSVGKVFDTLKTAGILDNTIVLFASDNGATPNGSNLPLRGGKHTMFEGGIRVPAAIYWKNGTLTGGKVYNGDFCFMDVYPTLCSLAGIERLPGRPLAGRDLSKSILSGKENTPAVHHWVWMREGATRTGHWKLIYNLEKMQLFNLKEDASETTNVADEYPEMLAKLIGMHEKWLEEVNCSPSYAVPRIGKDAKAAPEGEVLEFYAEQIKGVPGPHAGLKFIFALGYGDEYLDPPTPGDVIEYDICVAPDGRLDGFFYTPTHGWTPHFLSNTGYDQFGRLQTRGPGPRGGKGVWEHRVVGAGENCPNAMPFNVMIMGAKDAGTFHFYMDNLIVRKADGRIIEMWKDHSDSFTRWHEKPFMMTPDHKAFGKVDVKAVPLDHE